MESKDELFEELLVDDPKSEESGRHNVAFLVDYEDAGDSKEDATTVSTLVSITARERRMDETATRSRGNSGLNCWREFKELAQ